MSETITKDEMTEKEKIQAKFFVSLSKLSRETRLALSDTPGYDENRENRRFIIFCLIMAVIIIVFGISIITGDPFYRRTSGLVSEFILTFAIHSIILVGILKTIRQDESVLKHILVGTLSVFALGIGIMACRFIFVSDRAMVWAIVPLLAKFKFQEGFSPLIIAIGFIVPITMQYGVLLLMYKFDRLSLLIPYIAYLITTTGIIGTMMLSPLLGGV